MLHRAVFHILKNARFHEFPKNIFENDIETADSPGEFLAQPPLCQVVIGMRLVSPEEDEPTIVRILQQRLHMAHHFGKHQGLHWQVGLRNCF